MKKIIALFITLLSLFALASCSKGELETDPTTNLEFWILDEVNEDTFKNCTFLPGMFGGSMYLGSKYQATNDGSMEVKPDVYVVYTVTSYPDLSSKDSRITEIEIGDSEITVFGLTLKSTQEEIEAKMKELSFKESDGAWSKGVLYIRFTTDCIYLSVEVTNKFHIVF